MNNFCSGGSLSTPGKVRIWVNDVGGDLLQELNNSRKETWSSMQLHFYCTLLSFVFLCGKWDECVTYKILWHNFADLETVHLCSCRSESGSCWCRQGCIFTIFLLERIKLSGSGWRFFKYLCLSVVLRAIAGKKQEKEWWMRNKRVREQLWDWISEFGCNLGFSFENLGGMKIILSDGEQKYLACNLLLLICFWWSVWTSPIWGESCKLLSRLFLCCHFIFAKFC